MRYLIWLLITFYVLLPYDLLPDALGPLGRIDDIIVGLLLYWSTKRRAQPLEENNQSSQQAEEKPKSAHEILGVSQGASRDEIQSQYRKLMSQYHPDKVQSLGPELQSLAHEKSIEIQKAYESLVK